MAREPGGGRILAGEGSAYRLVVFDPNGEIVSSFGRPELEPTYRTEAEIAARTEDMVGSLSDAAGGIPESAAEAMRERLRSELKPFFPLTGVAVDRRGRTWVVSTRERDEGTEVDIFSRDGRYLEAVRVRDRALTLAIRGSLMAVMVERKTGTAEGLKGVDVYEIDSGPEGPAP